MTESSKSKIDDLFETSILETSLESILCTEELHCRPNRAPDHEMENRALVALAIALADSRQTILQTLAETILQVTESDSSGVSTCSRRMTGGRGSIGQLLLACGNHTLEGEPHAISALVGTCSIVIARYCSNTSSAATHISCRLHL